MAKPNENYDLKEASWKFVALKGIEVLLILFVIFGFYFLGFWVNGFNGTGDCGLGFNWTCPHTDSQNSVAVWSIGIIVFLYIIGALILWLIILLVAAIIIWLIILANWTWAKRWAETPAGKEKRLRKRWALLVGDKIQVEKGLTVSEYYNNMNFTKNMKQHLGKTGKIVELIRDEDTHYYRLDIDNQRFKWTVDMLKLI